MFNPKDKLDKMLMKISMYVILTFTVAYVISRVVYYVPDIMKWIMSAFSIMISLIAPLICGLVIAYLIWPLVFKIKDFLCSGNKKKNKNENAVVNNHFHIIEHKTKIKKEQEKGKTVLSIFLAYLIVIGLIVLLVYVTYAAIAEKIMNFEFNGVVDVVSEYMNRYEKTIDETTKTIKNLSLPDNIKEQLLSVTKGLTRAITDFSGGLVNTIKDISKNVMNLFLGIIISFYIILDADFFKDVWNKFLSLFIKKKKRNKINNFLLEINEILSSFVRGQLLDCFIVAIISVIALLIVNIDFAVILGIFAGLANVIPYFGPIIGMIPAAIIGLLSGEPLKALFAVIALIIIQQIDGNILAPRIVGGSVGVHPVFVIISIIIGAYFFGIVGMIIAVPICGIIKVVLNKILINKELKEERDIVK